MAIDENAALLGGFFYRLTLDGEMTVLYTFCSGLDCPDGSIAGSVTRVSDGDFYGISSFGGTNDSGNLFRISSSGQLTVLYNFCSQADCADGEMPQALPIEGGDGSVYGTTFLGGANNNGVIYRIMPRRHLHSPLQLLLTQWLCRWLLPFRSGAGRQWDYVRNPL